MVYCVCSIRDIISIVCVVGERGGGERERQTNY